MVLMSIFDVMMLDKLSINMLKWDSESCVLIMVDNCWLSVDWNELCITMMSIMGYYLVMYCR